MARERNVGVFDGFIYRGGGPMLAWLLHRISGIGIVVFVGLHILANAFNGQIGSAINYIFMSWVFQLLIFFCVLFHAINGLRIIILDLWPALLEHQREAIWIEWAFFLPIYAIAALVIISKGLAG